MKRSILISVITSLVILLVAGSIFAFPRNTSGKFGGPGFNTTVPRNNYQAAPAPCGTGPAFGMGVGLGRPFDLEEKQEFVEARMKLVFAEVLNTMDLSKEQAEEIYDILNKAKAELQEIAEKILEKHNEAYQAAINSDNDALEKARDDIQELVKERAELINETYDKIKSVITVEQLEKLTNRFGFQYRQRFNGGLSTGARNRFMNYSPATGVKNRFMNYLPGFILSDEFLEVLKDFIG
ncbi:MAG: hypothetical protein PWQ72_1509 [Pseudothermotoga sp.]|nr:hypothetical protein [Pseudothermotoga sp.]